MEWKEKEAKCGDIVRVKVTFYHHYGIFTENDTIIQFGLPDNVNRPASEVFVLETDVYEFLRGGQLEVMEPSGAEKKKMRPPKEIVRLARERIGQGGYDILHNNCEHFVNECAFGEHHSSFVSGVREKLRQKLNKKT